MAGTIVLAHGDDSRVSAPATVDARLVDAALRCVARWGVAKTSLDDVAREAGCSRATVYRAFPGGKDALFDTVLQVELERFIARVRDRVTDAATIEDALVAVIAEAGRTISSHAALQYLLTNEPELVLPRLAFGELDELFGIVRSVGGGLLARFLDDDSALAERVAEWVARITLSYTLSPATGFDTGDDSSVCALVRTFVLPGIERLATNTRAL